MVTRRVVLAAGLSAAVPPGGRMSAPAPTPNLFIACHPDDETLAMGVAVAEHAAAGPTHVLWLTDGEGSGALSMLNGATTSAWWGVLHNPAAEGYAPLDAAGMAAARVAEATTAVRCLATPHTVTTHRAQLPDGGLTSAAVQAAILNVADAISPGGPVRLKTHTWLVDDGADHKTTGQAVRDLAGADPARFGNPRFYVLPSYWTDPRLSQVGEFWDVPSAGVGARVINAVRAYQAWAPEAGRYAVGGHSVPGLLAQIAANPRCMVHT
jgi:LmbE family N-acetylglucosaminyl deacetylase